MSGHVGRAARTDDNQKRIVAALRRCGATVQTLAGVGDGCPDLLVGYRGENWLLEVKDGSKPPSRRRLSDVQKEWHARWRGCVDVVNNVDEALQAVGAM